MIPQIFYGLWEMEPRDRRREVGMFLALGAVRIYLLYRGWE